MSHTIELALEGLSCGHCVKRVKESLEQRPDVERAEVTIERAEVIGSADADALIDTGRRLATQRLIRWQSHHLRRKH